jgi:hypothetical protein
MDGYGICSAPGAGGRQIYSTNAARPSQIFIGDEQRANADLIASAPDLLAACIDFVSWVDGRIEADPAWFDKQAPFFQQAYHAQRSAILKATG